MRVVAEFKEEANSNINMVAAATEELIATIDDIAKNAGTAGTISESAVKKAGLASEKMHGLGNFAQSIGKFNETITEISEGISEIQTSTAAAELITTDDKEVDNTSGHISHSCGDLKANAVKLAELAKTLEQLISYFKLKM